MSLLLRLAQLDSLSWPGNTFDSSLLGCSGTEEMSPMATEARLLFQVSLSHSRIHLSFLWMVSNIACFFGLNSIPPSHIQVCLLLLQLLLGMAAHSGVPFHALPTCVFFQSILSKGCFSQKEPSAAFLPCEKKKKKGKYFKTPKIPMSRITQV